MESANTLILNEDVLRTLPDHKQTVFIFEWLRYLDHILCALNKVS